jgi:hypothetical protein
VGVVFVETDKMMEEDDAEQENGDHREGSWGQQR